jgi:hypothetical protein
LEREIVMIVHRDLLLIVTLAGTGNINQLVGDYTNPTLKPAAAD